MRNIILYFTICLMCGCVAAQAPKVMPGHENAQYNGDFVTQVTQGAKTQGYKWNTIYVDVPVKTAQGWSGQFVLTHSGTFDDLLQYTIESNGFISIKNINGFGGHDQIQRVKYNVKMRMAIEKSQRMEIAKKQQGEKNRKSLSRATKRDNTQSQQEDKTAGDNQNEKDRFNQISKEDIEEIDADINNLR